MALLQVLDLVEDGKAACSHVGFRIASLGNLAYYGDLAGAEKELLVITSSLNHS